MKKIKIKGKNKILIIFVALIFSIAGYFLDKNEEIVLNPLSDNVMRVHFIDVGQGDCSFIEFPDGKTMLIDAGNPENGSDISKYIRNLGKEGIDYVIATHPHSDHIGGMAKVLYDFDIGEIYMPKVSHSTEMYYDLLTVIDSKDMKIKTAKAGVNILNSDGIRADIISPAKEKYDNLNNYSAVVRIEYKSKVFLFMGDLEKDGERDLLREDIDCDVLKVGHHGSDTSSSEDFIQRASPRYSVISAGKDNDYGHPHSKVLYTLAFSTILRTDTMGTIVIDTDGNILKVNGDV